MKFDRRWLAAGGAAAVIVTALTGTAVAQSADDDADDLTGAARTQAADAALAHTGGGTVTDAETDDDGAAYDVEVTLDDGTEVELRLDQQFEVVSENTDTDDD